MDINKLKKDIFNYNEAIEQSEIHKNKYFSDCENIANLYSQVYSEWSDLRKKYEEFCEQTNGSNYPEYEEDVPKYFYLEEVNIKDEIVNVTFWDDEYHYSTTFEMPIKHFEDDGESLQRVLDIWQSELQEFEDEKNRQKEEAKLQRKRKQLEKLQRELGVEK